MLFCKVQSSLSRNDSYQVANSGMNLWTVLCRGSDELNK